MQWLLFWIDFMFTGKQVFQSDVTWYWFTLACWRKLEIFFEGDRHDKKIGVKEGTPQKLNSFGPFVFCLWKILLLFLIFLSFSWFFSPIFLPPQNSGGMSPSLKILGETRPPCFYRLCCTSPFNHWHVKICGTSPSSNSNENSKCSCEKLNKLVPVDRKKHLAKMELLSPVHCWNIM